METGRKRAPLEFIPPEGFPGDREPIAQRFWKYVDRSGGPDACWLWMGSLRRNNYGSIYIRDGMEQSHRVAWMLTNGRLPPHLVPDHLCKNHWCQNPAHMQLVTQGNNCTLYADLKSPFARNRITKTCPKGHPYAGENLAVKRVTGPRVKKDGTRYIYLNRICLTCYPAFWMYALIERAGPPGARLKWIGAAT